MGKISVQLEDLDSIWKLFMLKFHVQKCTYTTWKDTDWMLRPLYYAKDNSFKMYYHSNIRKITTPNPMYDFLSNASLLDCDNDDLLLFMHDFTSWLYYSELVFAVRYSGWTPLAYSYCFKVFLFLFQKIP